MGFLPLANSDSSIAAQGDQAGGSSGAGRAEGVSLLATACNGGGRGFNMRMTRRDENANDTE